jgi:hypothetical protein
MEVDKWWPILGAAGIKIELQFISFPEARAV